MRKQYNKRLKRKLFLSAFLLGTVMLFLPNSISAKSKKTVSVNIKEEYESCTFFVKLKNDGKYKAKIITPNGDHYKCDKIDSKNFRCVIPNVEPGKWKVVVSSSKNNKIGKISVSVTASKSTDNSITSDIKVGKDIVGLKVYFKDNFLCVDWTDDTCGSVEIKVINLDTNEVLSDDRTEDDSKDYETEIPTSVKKISVTVVPSESSGIRGAERVFTMKAFHPDGTASLPEGYYTNKDTINAEISINKAYRYMVTDNDQILASAKEKLEPGKYDVSIPLDKDGEHKIKFYIVDDKGNMKSTESKYYKDTIAPYVSLDKEYDGLETDKDVLTIEGNVKDFSDLVVGNKKISPSTDGHFEADCKLHNGTNNIVIMASDEAGNKTQTELTITKSENSRKNKKGIGLVPILIIIVSLVLLKRNKRKTKRGVVTHENEE